MGEGLEESRPGEEALLDGGEGFAFGPGHDEEQREDRAEEDEDGEAGRRLAEESGADHEAPSFRLSNRRLGRTD